MQRLRSICLALLALGATRALAQPPAAPALTLQQAREAALLNRPLLKARQFTAQTAQQATLQAQAARFPQVFGNVTAATASQETATNSSGQQVKLDTRIAAGALNNPTVLRRDAAGVVVSQLITDFGRTSNLIESAQFNETSQQQQLNATRAQVLLDVDNAYYGALEAQSILRVAEKTVESRQTVLDRVAALAGAS
jgi:outer membrane protein